MLHDTSFYTMQSCEDNFKIPIAFTSKKKELIVSKVFHIKKKNENNCTDLGGQDVIGQGLFGAVFVTKYTRREDGDLARKGEKAIVKKLLGSSLDFIDAFAKEARLLYDPQAGQHSWIQSCMPRSSGPYAGICLF